MSFIVCVRAVVRMKLLFVSSCQLTEVHGFFSSHYSNKLLCTIVRALKIQRVIMPAIIPAAQRLTENHHQKKKKQEGKKWVTDRNGYKLHQTFVCFIEPSIPLKWKLVCSDTHSPTKRCRSCTYHKLTFYGHDSNSSRTITDLECGKYRK